MKNLEIIRDVLGHLPCSEGYTRDSFGKCIKTKISLQTDQQKDNNLDLSKDVFPAPRTIRAYNQSEAYRHEANLIANAALSTPLI